MEIVDVTRDPPGDISVNETFRIFFKVIGAQALAFTFPFSNESLTESKLQFLREDNNG